MDELYLLSFGGGILMGVFFALLYYIFEFDYKNKKWKNTPAYTAYQKGYDRGVEAGFDDGYNEGFAAEHLKKNKELQKEREEFRELQNKFWIEIDSKMTKKEKQ